MWEGHVPPALPSFALTKHYQIIFLAFALSFPLEIPSNIKYFSMCPVSTIEFPTVKLPYFDGILDMQIM